MTHHKTCRAKREHIHAPKNVVLEGRVHHILLDIKDESELRSINDVVKILLFEARGINLPDYEIPHRHDWI